ncbi:PREDICTED: membrane-associated progesterone receptor component 2 [Dipodomys ordii]|uniref:Membrane-associated progesterone receptor component 2 n=1 Tax=Dipodomys ordii TaxID=10020 RepID=A0A1S3GQT9_DIPOR|nr:PREDICTED: membrane-associated progesterone receptor component 2 [Dipodomys ordii]
MGRAIHLLRLRSFWRLAAKAVAITGHSAALGLPAMPNNRGLDHRPLTRTPQSLTPSGPYGIFAGRDASRGLATFCLDKDALRDEYDDLSDLNAVQMESVREWEMQFKEKYDYVGRLLKPGEEPSEYTDEEDTKDHNKQD